MSIFDDYSDPLQFEAGGGLFGRLLSLQQPQSQCQPEQRFEFPDGQVQAGGGPDGPAGPVSPIGPQIEAARVTQPVQTPADGIPSPRIPISSRRYGNGR